MSEKEGSAKLSHDRMSFRTTSSVSTLLSWMVSDSDTKLTENEDVCVDDDDGAADLDERCLPVRPHSSSNGEGPNAVHERHDFQMDFFIKDEVESEVDNDEVCVPVVPPTSSSGEYPQAASVSTNAIRGRQDFGMDFFIKDEIEDCEDTMSMAVQRRSGDHEQLTLFHSSINGNVESLDVRPETIVESTAYQPRSLNIEEVIHVDDSDNDEIDVEDIDDHEDDNQAQLLLSMVNVSDAHPSSVSFKHKCRHCWRSFEEKQSLIDHLRSGHGVDTPQCHICQKICRTKSSLQKHVRIHDVKKMYKCYICNRRGVISLWELKRHMRTVHGAVMPFQCHICKKLFISEEVLKSHQTVHTGTQPYECNVCHRRFVCETTLTKHKQSHARKNLNAVSKCSICKLTLKSSSMAKHRKWHSQSPTSWKCPLCGLYFKSNMSLNTHLALHREGKLNELEERTKQRRGGSEDSLLIKEPSFLSSDTHRPMANMKGAFDCDLCGKSFKRVRSLRTHRIGHTGALMYRCESCDLDFKHRKEWAEHNKIHYACQLCELRFSFQSCLDTHVRAVHDKEKTICDICGKRVVSVSTHKLWVHRHRPGQFQCPTCLRWVKTEEDIGVHKLFHESKGKCGECEKTFHKPYLLKRHREVHDPTLRRVEPTCDKPYICEICSKSYRSRKLLKEHKVAVHEGAKNHQCEHCGKTYFYLSNVRWHKKLTGCGMSGKKEQPKNSSVEDLDYIP